MKKFLTSVFMLSMVLFSMSVFDSCKDYDEEEYNDLVLLISRNDSTLKGLLRADSLHFEQLIAKIQKAQDSCRNNCRIRMNILHDSIDAKADTTVVNVLIKSVADLKTADIALQNMDSVLQAQLDSLKALLSDSTGSVTNIITVLGKIADANTTIKSLGAELEALKTATSKNDSILFDKFKNYYTIPEVDSLLSFYTKQSDFVILDSKVTKVVKEAAYALALAKDDSIRIDALTTTINDVSKIANEALERAKNDSTWIANLTPEVKEALERAKNDSTWIANLTPEVKEALERAKNDSIWIKTLESTVNGLNNKVNTLDAYTKQLDSAIKTAEKNRISADSLLQNQIDALAVALNDLNSSVDDILTQKIPTLEQAYKDADQQLQDNIDALDDQVKQNTADIETINDNISDIVDRLNKVDEALKKLITGIVIQSTVNPVFGSFALPLGINSNVLIAFYGKNDNPVVFPTKETANYVKASETFTDEDWKMIDPVIGVVRKPGNSTFFNEGYGNAGTVYLTINPASVDFNGQKLELVNSKDEASKITLTPLKKENDVELMFGYTRAAETNGFYSANATLNEEDIDAVKINIQDGLASAFKNVLKERTFHSVGALASKLYTQFDGILPAQGLKASWTDYNGEHSVYSQYGIAATAIKPLSYAFLEELNVQTVPGYEEVIDFINRLAESAKNDIKSLWPDLSALDASSIAIRKLTKDDFNKYKVTYTASIEENTNYQAEKQTIDGKEYLVITHIKKSSVVKIPLTDDVKVEQDASNPSKWTVTVTESISDLVSDKDIERIIGKVDDISEFIDNVNDVIDDIDGTLGDAQGVVDKDRNKVKRYVDRLNEKMTSILNSANRRIQPILLVGNTRSGMKRASRMIGHATQMEGTSVEFILTSYTADIVTPAFKKHIAVTNVFKGDKSAQGGDADCKAALKAVNDQINTVINGDKCSVVANFQSGYLYEVAYSALDYSGKISMHKYYVRF